MSGYGLFEFVIVMAATYVLWLNVLILDAILYVRGEEASLKKVYDRRGVYGVLVALTVGGWVLLTGVYWLPVRIGVVFALLGGLLFLLGKKLYVLLGSINVSMFEPRKQKVRESELLEDVTIGVGRFENGRERQ